MTTLIDGLVAYWKLEEASGNRVDAHRSNDLTPANGPGNATGVIGNACQFALASSQYLSHTDNADLSTGDIDYTIAAWIKLSSKPSVYQMFISKDSYPASQRELFLYYDYASDRLSFYILNNSGGAVSVTANALGSPSTGVWYHVVVWHDKTSNIVGIRINDTYENTASTGAVVPSDSTAAFEIGARSASGHYSDAVIDEVGFWKRLLTSGEKAALYNGGAGRQYPFNVALHDEVVEAWHLGETGSADRVGSAIGNDLTAWGTPGIKASSIWENALQLDETGESLYHTDSAALSTGDVPFTISAWVFMDSKPSYYQGIVAKWHSGGSPNEFAIYYDYLNDRFVWEPGSYSVLADALGAPSLSTWYHILVWYDPYLPEAGIRIDDTHENLDISGSAPPDSSDDFEIGIFDQRNNVNVYFRGAIDEVVFWKRLLTADEKTAIYNSGNAFVFPWQAQANRSRAGIARGVGRGT